ncbi:MAG: TraB/GumN family protein [Sphingopyxis sp.]|nr:TraB/GumN family protein [Sphingopyxis sp.]
MTRFLKSLMFATAMIPLAQCANQTPVGSALAQAAPVETEDADPALWVVKDADTTIYLFGTVHLLKPGLSWFDEAVKTAFDKSDTLKIEVVLPEDQGEMVSRTLPLAIDQSGTQLSTLMTPEQRSAYEAAMTKYGLPVAQFEVFEPWFPGITLATVSVAAAGYDPNQGSERVLTAAAKAVGKPISGLETLEEQLSFFDSLPREAQLRFLNDTVAQLPTAIGEFADILLAWKQGNPEELGVRMNRALAGSEELAAALLYNRNERWASWVKTRMDEPGTVFMAVGAGHLAGEKSVQDYLVKQGLTAERVTY